MHRLSTLLAMIILFILSACGEETAFVIEQEGRVPAQGNADVGVEKDSHEVADAEKSPKKNDEPQLKLEENQLALTITTAEKSLPLEPAEFLFVLDDSASLRKDNIPTLTKAMNGFLDELQKKGLDYSVRIFTASMFLKQLNKDASGKFMQPRGLDGSKDLKQRYARGAYDYRGVVAHRGHQAINSIIDTLKTISDSKEEVDVEPLLCGFIDYLMWNKYNDTVSKSTNAPLGNLGRLQVVFVSDEDSDSEFATFSRFDGSLLSKVALRCYRDFRSESTVLVKRYNIYRSWKEYTYEWDKVYDRYTYSYTVSKISPCERHGYKKVPQNIQRLQSRDICATRSYACDDLMQPTSYSCQANGLTFSATTNHEHNKDKQCQVPSQYLCKKIVDGQIEEVEMDFNNAVNYINAGGQCRVKPGSASNKRILAASYQNMVGVQGCVAISCQSSNYKRVLILEKDKDNARYASCSLQQDIYNPYSVWIERHDGAGHLLRLEERNCAAHPGYRKLTHPNSAFAVSSSAWCEENIAEITLPAGVSTRYYMPSKRYTYSTSRSFAYRRSIADLASLEGVSADDITINSVKEERDLKQHIKVGPYAFQMYPPSSSVRNYLNFKETVISFDDIRDDQPKQPPTGSYLGHANNVQVKKVYESNGKHEERTVLETKVTEKSLGGSVADVKEFLNLEYPSLAVTFHAIVNLDGNSCPGVVESNIEEGASYKELARQTGGVVESICAPSYDRFLKKLTYKVLKQVNLTYKIDEKFVHQTLKEVKNQSQDKILKEGVDYIVNPNGTISFVAGAIKEDDLIVLTFVKQS